MRVFVKYFQDHKILIHALVVELLLQLQHHTGSKVYLESLLQRIIEPVVFNFDLSQYVSYVETRCYQKPSSPGWSAWNAGKMWTRTAVGGPIKAFHQYVYAHEQEMSFQLLQKIQSQAFELDKATCKEFLIPFIKEIINGVESFSVQMQECIQSLIATYITRIVGQEPKKPTDWARPEEAALKCDDDNCEECLEMSTFLNNPEIQHHNLCRNNSPHLKKQFLRFLLFKIDDTDSNHIVLTKTLGWWEYHHKDWEQRASKASDALQELPRPELEHCLADRYDEIMNLRMVKVVDESLANISLEQQSKKTSSIVPQKRPCDDLE